jgi:anion-transporting  ArsA/GET3 family ATPase
VALHFVTGKGGVGKTRLALLLAKKMPRAVLAETAQSLDDESKRVHFEPPPIYRFSRSDLAEDFLISTIKIRAIAQWLARSSLFQTLLSLAPNLHELLLIQKWVEICDENPVIIDAPSTGHFIAIFDAIKTAQVVFDGGSLRHIADEIDDFLNVHEVHLHLVTIPEHSALAEMNEIEEKISSLYPKFKIHRILNRKHVAPLSKDLPAELLQLATERARLEEMRVQNERFEKIILEGEESL